MNSPIRKRWHLVPPGNTDLVSQLSAELNIDRILANLLVQRGIQSFEEARAFFRPSLDDLHDPYLMRGMEAAVARIMQALDTNQRIMVYGDYDVDGTTSVAMVFDFLSRFTSNIDFYVPDRYTEGYGLSFVGMEHAIATDVKLIIALDCGIKGIEEARHAAANGIDLIVCDHHRPGDVLPPAAAILNPKQHNCDYPYDELSGCGIGFKLLMALAPELNLAFEELVPYLDLVCVSIASDIVPITGENRTLAWFGLQQLRNEARPGLSVLMDLAGKSRTRFTISDVVFQLGPRINAAGRMKHGKQAVELLTAHSEAEAQQAGRALQEFNQERQNLDQHITDQALAMIDGDPWMRSAKSNVLFNQHWHKGVVGIVASRVIETWHRPTIVLTESEGKATGSARSVGGFDVYDAIYECRELLDQFGGHKYAAGLTMPLENIQPFRERFNEVVSASITEEQLTPTVRIDADLDFDRIDGKFFRILQQFEPFGPGNLNPSFRTRGLCDAGQTRVVGSRGEHLKLDVFQPKTNIRMNGIAFKLGNACDAFTSGQPADMVYSLETNEWNGNVSLQMRVRDLQLLHVAEETNATQA